MSQVEKGIMWGWVALALVSLVAGVSVLSLLATSGDPVLSFLSWAIGGGFLLVGVGLLLKPVTWRRNLKSSRQRLYEGAKKAEIPPIGDGHSALFFLPGPTLSHDFTDSEGEDAPSADQTPTSSLPPANLAALKDVTSWVVSSDGYSTDSSSETNADSIIIEGKQFIRNEEGVFMDKNGDELLPQEEDGLLDLIRDSLNELKQFGGEQLPEI
jgi:hypothetical protein